MAQTEAMPRPPPGLGARVSDGASDGASSPTAEDRSRREIISEIEASMQSKIEDIMKQGRQMVQKESKQWNVKFNQVTADMSMFQRQVQALSAENVELKQLLFRMTERMGVSQARPPSPPSTAEAAGLGGADAGMAKFAPVPDFPIPYTANGPPPAQLFLAEYLGDAPAPAPPKAGGPGDVRTFTFTLRKADGADLGLSVSHNETDQVLRVEGIKEKGAVEAWNKQCNAGGTDKAILPGDNILSVNSISYDPKEMLVECRDKQLLRLTVMRGRPAPPQPQAGKAATGPPSAAAAPVTPKAALATTLRANASVFVPGMQSPESSAAPASPSAEADSGAESASQTTPVKDSV